MIFDKYKIVTYSMPKYWAINEEYLDKAEIIIKSRDMADTIPLKTYEILESILSSMDESEKLFKMKLEYEIKLNLYDKKRVGKWTGEFRLTSKNYNKLLKLTNFFKLPEENINNVANAILKIFTDELSIKGK